MAHIVTVIRATVVNGDILVISLNFYTNDVLNHIAIGDYKYACNP